MPLIKNTYWGHSKGYTHQKLYKATLMIVSMCVREVSRCEYLTCMSRKRACPRRAVTLNRRKHSCAREVPDISVPSVRVDLSKKRKIPRAPDQTAPFIPPHINRRGGAACMDQLMWVRELEWVSEKERESMTDA